jgi:hypothetical protein
MLTVTNDTIQYLQESEGLVRSPCLEIFRHIEVTLFGHRFLAYLLHTGSTALIPKNESPEKTQAAKNLLRKIAFIQMADYSEFLRLL